jgi:predicted acylesterase/phospholipase RssA
MAGVVMPLRCQLAIQGGGAKVVALLAAVEAVQQLQREGTVQVTRVAGTSAGSIVAALFAAGSDLASVRQELVRKFGADVARLFPPPSLKQAAVTTWWGEKPLFSALLDSCAIRETGSLTWKHQRGRMTGGVEILK